MTCEDPEGFDGQFDDDFDEDEEFDPVADCNWMPGTGSCMKIGSEECEFDCPLRDQRDIDDARAYRRSRQALPSGPASRTNGEAGHADDTVVIGTEKKGEGGQLGSGAGRIPYGGTERVKLKIAEDLALPLEVVTEKLAFLGRTGSGKTYAAMKLAELMLDAGAQIVALDPVGAWHGLRIGGSFNIYIFGGLRGDFPLEPTGGALLADLIADRGISAVLDVSQFIRAEQVRFAVDFAARFFHRKKAAPSAVHIFLEECQEFVPQNPGDREAHMLHHFERLWKLGRNFGIGGSLISQRPQEINKKALNQAGTLFVFNMTGPQERKAIADWTRQQGIDDDIEGILPTLKTGHPHVWSPTFLAVSKTVHILPKLTADVSMTPKVGARIQERPLTPIDVEKLKTDMAATVERSKADDPKELRKEIAGLKRQLAEQKSQTERVEVSVLIDEDRKLLVATKAVFDQALGVVQFVEEHSKKLQSLFERIGTKPVPAPARTFRPTPPLIPPRRSTAPVSQHIPAKPNGHSEPGIVGKGGLRRMLTALAQCPNGLTKQQIGVRAGLSSKSGTFGTYLGQLRSNGWIVEAGGKMFASEEGMKALGTFEELPRGSALLDYWLGELGDSGAARMLRALYDAGGPISKSELGERAGLSAGSGTFGTYLGKLRSLELVEGPSDALEASEIFYED